MRLRMIAAGLFAISAYSQVPSGTVNVISKHSGKCLDMRGGPGATQPGVLVQQWTCLGGAQTNQIFTFRRLAGGEYEIIPSNSELPIEVSGGASAPEGSRLEQWGSSGKTFQKWTLTATDCHYTIHPVSEPKMCMDVRGISASNGAAVQVWPCSGGSNQAWELSPITVRDPIKLSVELRWKASTTAGVTYNIYRALEGGPYSKLASRVAVTSYTDSTVRLGDTYQYAATAVTCGGQESARSNIAAVRVP